MKKDNTTLLWVLGIVGAGAILATGTGVATGVIEIPGLPPLTPTAFVKKYYPFAVQSAKISEVPALVTLAQAGLESAWGKSAYGNNFFGIKKGSDWKGETQLLRTWECGKTGNPAKDGIKDQVIAIYKPNDPAGVCKDQYSYRVYGSFRKYFSPVDGFLDHGTFLNVNSRYHKAFDYKSNPEAFAKEIAKAGYATAPNYGDILVQTIAKVRTILT